MNIRRPYQILLLLVVTFSAFYPTLFAEVNSVDDRRMLMQVFNTDTFNLKGLFIPGSSGCYYRPLLMLTYLADHFVWGQQVVIMHFENIALHAINSVLVFVMAAQFQRVCRLKTEWFPLVCAVVFTLHPLATEPVNWISGRTDLLAGMFLFLSLALFFDGLRTARRLPWVASGFSLFLATLCKDPAVFAVPGFICFTLCHVTGADEQEDSRRPSASGWFSTNSVWTVFVYGSVAAAYFGIRHAAFVKGDSGITSSVKSIGGGSIALWDMMRVVLKSYGFYAKKLLVPWPLNFAIISVANYYVIAGILALTIIGYLVLRRKMTGACLFFSSCLIVPALLVPLVGLAWTPIAERYLYMSLPTFILAVAAVLTTHLSQSAWMRVLVGAGIIVVLTGTAWSTVQRNLVWQHNLTLFQDTVTKSPDFAPAKNELAFALSESGYRDAAQSLYLANYTSQTDKYSIISILNKARVLAARGEVAEARSLLKDGAYGPENPVYPEYLEDLIRLDGQLVAEAGTAEERRRLNAAITSHYEELLKVTGDPFIYYRIGQRFLARNEPQRARKYFELAYTKAPLNAHYRSAAQKLSEKLKDEK